MSRIIQWAIFVSKWSQKKIILIILNMPVWNWNTTGCGSSKAIVFSYYTLGWQNNNSINGIWLFKKYMWLCLPIEDAINTLCSMFKRTSFTYHDSVRMWSFCLVLSANTLSLAMQNATAKHINQTFVYARHYVLGMVWFINTGNKHHI